MSSRTILHLDMDAFYASVEQIDHPEWKVRPVIVGADPRGGKGRGVVAACSYEARACGIRSALPIGRAWTLCPQGVYVRPRMRRYVEVSGGVFSILREYTDLVEPLSIDEAFLDVTDSEALFGSGDTIGRQLKARIRGELGLVASVGVAPNKFLAKVASDLGKPDGFVVVHPGDEALFLAPLPLSRLWGVGPKTEARLRKMGLATIGDLARLRPEDLRAPLGDAGPELLALARGEDHRPVVPEWEAKSIGAETTFEVDTDDLELVRRTLLGLSERVAARLRAEGWVAAGVTLKYRDEGFRTVTRSAVLPAPTDLSEELFRAVGKLLQRVPLGSRKVRLVGVTATRLRSAESARPAQLDLFSSAEPTLRDRRRELARSVDGIRSRFGQTAITRAALLEGDGAERSPRKTSSRRRGEN